MHNKEINLIFCNVPLGCPRNEIQLTQNLSSLSTSRIKSLTNKSPLLAHNGDYRHYVPAISTFANQSNWYNQWWLILFDSFLCLPEIMPIIGKQGHEPHNWQGKIPAFHKRHSLFNQDRYGMLEVWCATNATVIDFLVSFVYPIAQGLPHASITQCNLATNTCLVTTFHILVVLSSD